MTLTLERNALKLHLCDSHVKQESPKIPIVASPPVAAIVEPILRDIRATIGDRVTIVGDPPLGDLWAGSWLETAQPYEQLCFVTTASGSPCNGLRLPNDNVETWQVLRAVLEVQEFIIENVDNTWPRCPKHHTHPLWPEEDGTAVVWRCSADRRVAIPLGELA